MMRLLDMKKINLRKRSYFVVVVVILVLAAMLGKRQMKMLAESESAAQKEPRKILFTDATLDMSINEIKQLQKGEAGYTVGEGVCYENRDYTGDVGTGTITFAPFLHTAMWETAGDKDEIEVIFDEIRELLSAQYQEEVYQDTYGRFCKWVDKDTNMTILLHTYGHDRDWILELSYSTD